VDWWSVRVEARADGTGETDGNGHISDSALGAFTDLTQPYDGSIAVGAKPRRWTARVSIEAAGPSDAVAEALRLVTALAAQAGLPGWPVVGAAAVRQDVAGDLTDVPTAGPLSP
jgi:hypothetical protein